VTEDEIRQLSLNPKPVVHSGVGSESEGSSFEIIDPSQRWMGRVTSESARHDRWSFYFRGNGSIGYRSDRSSFRTKDEAWEGVRAWLRRENTYPVYQEEVTGYTATHISALIRGGSVDTKGWAGIQIEPDGKNVRINAIAPRQYETSATIRASHLVEDLRQFFAQY
jgi:hypothetical protein